MEQLELVLTSELLEKFYCVSFDTCSVNLQGAFSNVKVVEINEAFKLTGSSLKLWGVSRGGYVNLEMGSDTNLFQVDGKGYPLNITLTS